MDARIKVLQIARHNLESKLKDAEKQMRVAKFNYQKTIAFNSPGNIKAGLLVNQENAVAGLRRVQEMIQAADQMLEEEMGKIK